MSTSTILIYIFFGSAALAYITYGKTQRKVIALFSGIGLAIVPYFGLEMWLMVLVSLLLMTLPFVIRL
ncbi:hypothetical protein [Sulfurovum riftiae]|uniref:Amino acid transport protein n=1 Tax=Sulfurovum riftiae TaxID=1630136 RepID=A0A151CEH0_9BACT|nr:hypothetical protein [Sulfurovum riftiae]KYJ85930.1 hypothetical protein AS592_04900 [Sulfurovum riftiae]